MTCAEACTLLVETLRDLRIASAERDAYRLVAVQAIHYANELQRERDALRERYHRAIDDARRLRGSILSQSEHAA